MATIGVVVAAAYLSVGAVFLVLTVTRFRRFRSDFANTPSRMAAAVLIGSVIFWWPPLLRGVFSAAVKGWREARAMDKDK